MAGRACRPAEAGPGYHVGRRRSRRLNPFLNDDVPDVAGHLFGRDRIALTAVSKRTPQRRVRCALFLLRHSIAPREPDRPRAAVVAGWDRRPCQSCSGLSALQQRQAALAFRTVDLDRVLDRDRNVLGDIGTTLQWPTQYDRVTAAARGIYRSQPDGIATWAGFRSSHPLDHAHPHWWRLGDDRTICRPGSWWNR